MSLLNSVQSAQVSSTPRLRFVIATLEHFLIYCVPLECDSFLNQL